MSLTVHHLQVSQSERIPWLCEELGIPYELKTYKRSPLLCPPELADLTPMRSAPVVEDTSDAAAGSRVCMTESAAIAEYIIHRHGEGRLALPPSHPAYADYLFWFHFANGSLQPGMARYMTVRVALEGQQMPGVEVLLQRTRGGLDKVLGTVEARLAENAWLAGEEFTAADIMTVFSLTTFRVFCPYSLAAYPNILGYLQRIGQREAYQRAMAKGDPDMTPLLGAEEPEWFPAMKAAMTRS